MKNVGWWTIFNFISFVVVVTFALTFQSHRAALIATFNAGTLAISAINLKLRGWCA